MLLKNTEIWVVFFILFYHVLTDDCWGGKGMERVWGEMTEIEGHGGKQCGKLVQ